MLQFEAALLRRHAAEIYKRDKVFTQVVSQPDKQLGHILVLQKRISGEWLNEMSKRDIKKDTELNIV